MSAPFSPGDTGSHRALLRYEVEAEQRRVYDYRVATWPVRLASVIIGVLWLVELAGHLPWNDFVDPGKGEKPNGVAPNTQITVQQPGPYVDSGAGLYHRLTQEASYGNWLVPFYGDAIKNVVLPIWRFFGWLTFFVEGLIVVSLLLGLLSRVGGFFSSAQALNLFLGLAQAPGGWACSYVMLFTFGLVFMLTGPGRFLGVDQWLRPKLRELTGGHQQTPKYIYLLT